VPGVALQGRGWPHRIDSDGDGAPAGLTSRFDPAEQRKEGSRVRPPPLRGRGALAVLKWAAQRHGVDAGLAAQSPQWRGWASLRELAEQRRGVIPRRVMAQPCRVRALSARTHTREQVRLRGSPRARRNPLEGGVSPRARRNPLEGALEPSSEVEPARGGREPSSEVEPARGGA
jgi:hypothetical protein